MQQEEKALVILVKYPRVGKVKTRLIPAVGDIVAKNISKLFLVDILNKFTSVENLKIIVSGAFNDNREEFLQLFERNSVPYKKIEMLFPRSGTMEGDIVSSYRYAFENNQKVVLTGCDIPYLSINMVNKMFSALDSYDLVFYPNIDGGACPHGMKKPIDLFTKTNSRTINYLDYWLERISDLELKYQMFMPIFDIDTFENLKLFYHWQRLIEKSGNIELFCQKTMEFLKTLFRD